MKTYWFWVNLHFKSCSNLNFVQRLLVLKFLHSKACSNLKFGHRVTVIDSELVCKSSLVVVWIQSRNLRSKYIMIEIQLKSKSEQPYYRDFVSSHHFVLEAAGTQSGNDYQKESCWIGGGERRRESWRKVLSGTSWLAIQEGERLIFSAATVSEDGSCLCWWGSSTTSMGMMSAQCICVVK